jgi:beta-galactosidase/beta-glucuronidase
VVSKERYRPRARDMLRALIDQHYNHPSIIIWGFEILAGLNAGDQDAGT